LQLCTLFEKARHQNFPLMKYIILLVFFAAYLLNEGCQFATPKAEMPRPAKTATESATASTVADSVKIAAWDALVAQVETQVRGLKIENFKPQLYSEKDGMGVVKKGDQIARLTFGFFPKDNECREYYYFDDQGNFIYYRFLGWNQAEPSAREVICYADKGRFFQVLERRVKLQPGQKPQPLLAEPQIVSTMNRDSLFLALNGQLDKLKEVVAKGK
jgi:hypothetical protein